MTSRRERPPSGRNNVTARGEGLPRYAQVRFLIILKLLPALWLVLMRLNSFAFRIRATPDQQLNRIPVLQDPTTHDQVLGPVHDLTTQLCQQMRFYDEWENRTTWRRMQEWPLRFMHWVITTHSLDQNHPLWVLFLVLACLLSLTDY